MLKALRQIGAVGMTINSGGFVTLLLPCNLENTFDNLETNILQFGKIHFTMGTNSF